MVTRHKLKNNPSLALQTFITTEPKTLKSALKYPQWVTAMNEELQALNQNNTWTLVLRPKNANIIGSKWVY